MQEMTAPPDSSFESALRREVLRSERRRMMWQAGVLAGVLTAMLAARIAAPELLWSYFHGRMAAMTPVLVLLPFIAYELLGAAIFARHIHRDRTPFTMSLRARAARLDHFAISADDFATAGVCRATAARIREIASEIDRLEYLLATLERRPT